MLAVSLLHRHKHLEAQKAIARKAEGRVQIIQPQVTLAAKINNFAEQGSGSYAGPFLFRRYLK